VRFGLVVILSLAFLPHSLFAGPDDETEGSLTVSQSLFQPDFDFLLPGEESQGSPNSPILKHRLKTNYESDEEFLNPPKRQRMPYNIDADVDFLFPGNESQESPLLSYQSEENPTYNGTPSTSPQRSLRPLPNLPSSLVSVLAERQDLVAASPTALKTPIGGIKKVYRPVREGVARSLEATLRGAENTPINSPSKLKSVFRETFPANHFTHSGVFQDVPYYLDLRLFDPQQAVICVRELSVTVETNLDRMQRGCAPFSYKVTPTVEQYLDQPIMVGNPNFPWGVDYTAMLNRKQNPHRMDIHHLAKTMEDGVTPLPSDFHHGTDFGVVVKKGEILAYGVSKKDARPFLKKGAKYFADCLHPDFGDSKIDRKAFGKWRTAFWKYVAELIIQEKENGTYNPFSPVVPKTEIFSITPPFRV